MEGNASEESARRKKIRGCECAFISRLGSVLKIRSRGFLSLNERNTGLMKAMSSEEVEW